MRSQPQPGADLHVVQEQPFNAGPSLGALCRQFVTPRELFYVRNHGTLPHVTPEQYVLTVTGMVRTPLRLSLADLRQQFSRRTLTATLVCAGNRRNELAQVAPIPDELPWGAEAIGNAIWEGVGLDDVLAAAGVEPGAQHVAFVGLDEIEKHGQRFGFGASIALEKAQQPGVLLAHSMNGGPLTPEHGYPLRGVVPGYIGARSVKWLANIHLQAGPSENYYQDHAYKCFPPEVTPDTVDWSGGTVLEDVPVSAAICEPVEGATIEGERLVVCGYAYAGGRRIARVEVSCDGREPWVAAELAAEQGPWTWRLWQVALPLGEQTRQIVARAWDGEGRGQPVELAEVWNFKGYLNTAWHRVTIRRP